MLPTSSVQQIMVASVALMALFTASGVAHAEEAVSPFSRYDLAVALLDHGQSPPVFNCGFISAYDGKHFLVVAKQTALVYSPKVDLIIPIPDQEATRILLNELGEEGEPIKWQHHPTTNLSVAELDCGRYPGVFIQVQSIAINLSTFSDKTPPRGTTVETVGIPKAFPPLPGKHIELITIESSVASKDFEMPRNYIADVTFVTSHATQRR